MAQIITIPKLGLTMEKGIITHWYVQEGDYISKGEPLFELETDKITDEVESPEDAYIIKILAEKSLEYDVYTPVCVIGEQGETYEIPLESAGIQSTIQEAKSENLDNAGFQPQCVDVSVKITPVARKLADEKGIDISKIKGTGPEGRITREDVLAVSAEKQVCTAKEIKNSEPVKAKLSGTRKIVAQRMTESKRNIPHVYFRTSVDASSLIKKRNDSNKKYSYNDLIIKAAAQVIEEVPIMNALYVDDAIEYRDSVNIGLAVDRENGLIVPVIKNAGKSLDEISEDTKAIIDNVKSNKLSPDDLTGGTFTISNLGMYDIDEFTAIINPGESAILAVSKISDKVFADLGVIKIRPEMNLTLSVDHRLIDGAIAAQFLCKLKTILES